MTITVHKFTVTGISSLLMHNPAGSMVAAGGDLKMKTKKIPAPEEEAKRALYVLEDGRLYLPSIAFRSSLLRGCTGKRVGKLSAASQIAAGVFNAEPNTLLFHPVTGQPITEWKTHMARVVVQRAAVIRGRPEIPEWGAVVTFELDSDFVNVELVQGLLNIAGRIAGVGDWRPEKRGPHGRYRVE